MVPTASSPDPRRHGRHRRVTGRATPAEVIGLVLLLAAFLFLLTVVTAAPTSAAPLSAADVAATSAQTLGGAYLAGPQIARAAAQVASRARDTADRLTRRLRAARARRAALRARRRIDMGALRAARRHEPILAARARVAARRGTGLTGPTLATAVPLIVVILFIVAADAR